MISNNAANVVSPINLAVQTKVVVSASCHVPANSTDIVSLLGTNRTVNYPATTASGSTTTGVSKNTANIPVLGAVGR